MILNHRIMGQGPVLFILHGLFGSMDNWTTIAKSLSTNNSVCLVDLRNHGNSFHNDELSPQIMAEDLELLIGHLNIDTYSILGHSLGGKVAMFHAANNQHLIKGLVVVDIGPKSYPPHHQNILEGLSSINPEVISSRSQADTMLQPFVPEPGVRQFLLKNLKRNREGNFSWKMNLNVIRDKINMIGNALPGNAKVEAPTLFIRGGLSNYILKEDFSTINSQFPNANITTIEESGHWVHAEAPDKFLQIVTDFLEVE